MYVVDGGTGDGWWVEAEKTGDILGLGRVFLPEDGEEEDG